MLATFAMDLKEPRNAQSSYRNTGQLIATAQYASRVVLICQRSLVLVREYFLTLSPVNFSFPKILSTAALELHFGQYWFPDHTITPSDESLTSHYSACAEYPNTNSGRRNTWGLGTWKLMQTALTDRNASYFSGSCCSSQVDLVFSLVGATRDDQSPKNDVRLWRTVYSLDLPVCMPSTIVSRPCVLLAFI